MAAIAAIGLASSPGAAAQSAKGTDPAAETVSASASGAAATSAALSSSDDSLEKLFQSQAQKEELLPAASAAPTRATPLQSEIREIKDLNKLSEFKDVAILQRKFLPKTQRFEFYLAPSIVVNDAFFNTYGLNARLSYSFREQYAVELLGMILSSSQRDVTSELRDQRQVNTTTLVSPRSYFGADFKWTPIYGKMSWVNKAITPFDLYFSLGLGQTGTSQGSETTLHLGTGQTFAVTKSFAWRWDFSWNFFSAQSNVAVNKDSQVYNNLFLTLGASWFFPEATYR